MNFFNKLPLWLQKLLIKIRNTKYFSRSGNGFVSTYSSNISCWGQNYSGTSQYDIRFSFDDIPQYRTSSSNYSYADLNITGIVETNLSFLNDTDFTVFSQDTTLSIFLLNKVVDLIIYNLKK